MQQIMNDLKKRDKVRKLQRQQVKMNKLNKIRIYQRKGLTHALKHKKSKITNAQVLRKNFHHQIRKIKQKT